MEEEDDDKYLDDKIGNTMSGFYMCTFFLIVLIFFYVVF